jgi:disulfide oxidoreductase YuzD
MKIHWMAEPEDHDYPAAKSYLLLHFVPHEVTRVIERLRLEDMSEFKAKDIFRASGLSLLGVSNDHVQKNLDKIKNGKELSPLLLVRCHPTLIIADGYHRMCAVYTHDEDALIPCKIATV